MINIAILADDLTGACDTGIKLRYSGWPVSVSRDIQTFTGTKHTWQGCVSVNTESRGLEAGKAYEAVYGLARKFREVPPEFLYKKVDSVLRGNIGREIDALLDALDLEYAVLCSALPENKRYIRDGILQAGDDRQDSPAPRISVVQALKKNSCYQCEAVPLETVRRGTKTLLQALNRAASRGSRILAVDAVTEGDLETIAAAILAAGKTVLAAGSAGLLDHLCRQLPKPLGRWDSAWKASERKKDSVIIAVGSQHPVMLEQIRDLTKTRKDLILCPLDVKEPDLATTAAEKALRCWNGKASTFLVTTNQILSGQVESVERFRVENRQDQKISGGIATATARILDATDAGVLIASGGDTAQQLLDALEISRLELLDEPIAGIVRAVFRYRGKNRQVVTKSGGFGDPSALTRILDVLE